ncbi:MAG: killer suppression protein HigA, partial [Bacteroidia bacterium]
MEVNFKSNKLERTFSSPKEIMKAYGTRARKVNQRLSELKAAPNLKEMKNFPQANCHRLSTGNFAVDISANYRIVFEIDESLPLSDIGELVWVS